MHLVALRFSLLPGPYHRYHPHRYRHVAGVLLEIGGHTPLRLAEMSATVGHSHRRYLLCCHRRRLSWAIPVEGGLGKLVGIWAGPLPNLEEAHLVMQENAAVVVDHEDFEG